MTLDKAASDARESRLIEEKAAVAAEKEPLIQ